MTGRRLGVLSGAFNPVTRAHLALIDAARAYVDEIVLVVPRVYPHKKFEGATLEDRVKMLQLADPRHRVQVTDAGLFIDIARELRQSAPDAGIVFICGRDAAERILAWDYGAPDAVDRMFDEFHLLVADREGAFAAPAHLSHCVRNLSLKSNFDDVSSTEVRRRIASGEAWEHLVPGPIADLVRRVYAAS